ncbi:MAG: hypothetical protein ACRDRT_10125, partial [Pseudonocardiaceae bacterium]
MVPFFGALLVLSLGPRLHLTAVPVLDAFLTLGWVAGLPSVLARLDRGGRIGSRWAISAAVTSVLLVLALGSGQGNVAAMVAAAGGALLALLASRSSTPTIEVTVWLPLGFTLAVATVLVTENLPGMAGVTVAPLLWAVPLVDALVGSLARARRRLSGRLPSGGHLLRRLSVRGFSERASIAMLIGVQMAVAGAGLAVGRGWLGSGLAVAIGLMPVAVLVVIILPAKVHRGPVTGLTPWLRRTMIALAVGLPVLSAPAVWALVGAKSELEVAARQFEGAFQRVREGADASKSADPTKETKPANDSAV